MNTDFSWGGMENQTLTSLCPNCWSEGLAAHEFAHQWFGDMITCATWADIWLNEGFASWSEPFWFESYSGYATYKAEINNYANIYLQQNPGWAISNPDWAVTTPSLNVLFNYSVTYAKGACVLHQLRYVLGDSLFFATLKAYCSDSSLRFGSATINNFAGKVNAITGEDYSWFFNEWIFQANNPVYQNAYDFELVGSNQWRVNLLLKQVQTNSDFFKMPVEIMVKFEDGTDTVFRAMNDANDQRFEWLVDKKPVILIFDPYRQIVLKTGSTLVGLDSPKEMLPATSLDQNIPNPTNRFAKITYNLAEPGQVRMELNDLQGNPVRRIVDEYQSSGKHETLLDCTGLASGTYIYTLNVNMFVQSKKLVITR